MKTIYLFSDGSCLKNPGIGGWAYILKYKDKIKKDSGACLDTTNNQMELLSVIKALEVLKEACLVELYSDSSYVCNAINLWLKDWIKKDFKGKKNEALWKEYIKVSKNHLVRANWIKGHNGHEENEECDKLARQAAINLQRNNFE